MLKSIKLRLYLNKTQTDYVNDLLGSYRFVYNKCLDLKKGEYEKNKNNFGLKELGNYFHNDLTKNVDYEWLKNHNTKVLKQSIINLLDSYKNFFKNNSGFPRFKSKKDNKLSCRFPVDTISKNNIYLDNKISLTKQLKNIRFKCSDNNKIYLNKFKNNIKSATLTKTKTNKYFLSILIDGEIENKMDKSNKIIAIDLGIKDFIVDSEGNKYKNIKIKRNNEKKLKKLHRKLSRKKGIKNKTKSRIKLARFNEKLNNIKENYLHHIANKLLNENQVIVMENLNVSGMMKNGNLAKSIQELSLYRFKQILKYKSDWYGKQIIEIDIFYPSSKLCSCCGEKNDNLKLSDREWICNNCGTHHDRDLNASINILNEGKRILNKLPIRSGELTPLESYQ